MSNISELATEESARTPGKASGGLCVRIYERADGTVILQDCPYAVKQARNKLLKYCLAGVLPPLIAVTVTYYVNGAYSQSEVTKMGGMVRTDSGYVLLAKRDIAPGEKVADNVELQLVADVSTIPAGAVRSTSGLTNVRSKCAIGALNVVYLEVLDSIPPPQSSNSW